MTTALLLALAAQLTPTPGGEIADELSRRMTPEVLVARSVRPAVVHVVTEVLVPQQTIFGQRLPDRLAQSAGSGVVIFEDGYVVTNNHVIRGAQNIVVSFDPAIDDRQYPATVVSAVPEEDLALLKISSPGPFPTVPLGTSSDLMIAEPVLAIGNPYGQSFTVSTGIISGLHRDVEADGLRFTNLIQTDASINPGNSGGPLLNINGQLIGINTVVNRAAENMGFAIPVDRVRQVLEDSLLSPSMARTWLGFDLADQSLEVARVAPGGPADRAELRSGDRVVAVDGREVTSAEEFTRARLPLQPGQEMQLTVSRGGRSTVLSMRGWERRDGLLFERAGLLVEPIVIGIRSPKRLLRVVDVRPGGPAADIDLRTGDLIEALRAEGSPRPFAPQRPDDLALFVNALAPGARVTLDVWRDSNANGRYELDADYSELLQGTLDLR
ncbi:trypsin-like peptidase domain-containing protein [Engelhardtia mirabilis]|uniref:Serine protease HtrA n=1 Tax=Engelhardtia mirabilis TaxID=2528011 RepID=A0A518BK97_9BACT|nr:Putative serine protease HtrA [Planctomycetes bacterium Pla133]QDV01722.1 Putative serine protease HtrA [Planctomycetes bacterium Pla86]